MCDMQRTKNWPTILENLLNKNDWPYSCYSQKLNTDTRSFIWPAASTATSRLRQWGSTRKSSAPSWRSPTSWSYPKGGRSTHCGSSKLYILRLFLSTLQTLSEIINLRLTCPKYKGLGVGQVNFLRHWMRYQVRILACSMIVDNHLLQISSQRLLVGSYASVVTSKVV